MSTHAAGPEIEKQLTAAARELAVRRMESGLSLKQMAALSELSSAGISRIENGERIPSLRTLLLMSKALGLTILIERGTVTVS